ncbi:MAG: hemerythrin domain-containing protein [Sulfuritalea sp.]|nr:hemerythrin domain-containing protein [Sulfuritalea sp.]
MDIEYRIGIDEIDAQHKEITEAANAVLEAIESQDKWHLVHYIVVRLYELLRFHFAVEESVMHIVKFPEIEEHKRVHRELLLTVERLKASTLSPRGGSEDETTIKQFSFLPHILGHDKKLAEYIATNMPTFGR